MISFDNLYGAEEMNLKPIYNSLNLLQSEINDLLTITQPNHDYYSVITKFSSSPHEAFIYNINGIVSDNSDFVNRSYIYGTCDLLSLSRNSDDTKLLNINVLNVSECKFSGNKINISANNIISNSIDICYCLNIDGINNKSNSYNNIEKLEAKEIYNNNNTYSEIDNGFFNNYVNSHNLYSGGRYININANLINEDTFKNISSLKLIGQFNINTLLNFNLSAESIKTLKMTCLNQGTFKNINALYLYGFSNSQQKYTLNNIDSLYILGNGGINATLMDVKNIFYNSTDNNTLSLLDSGPSFTTIILK